MWIKKARPYWHPQGVSIRTYWHPHGVSIRTYWHPQGVSIRTYWHPLEIIIQVGFPPIPFSFFLLRRILDFTRPPSPLRKYPKYFEFFSVKDFHLVSNNSELMLKMSIFHACLKLKYCSNTISTTTTSITTTTAIKIVNNSIYTVCLKISRASTKPPNRTAPRCGFFQWKKLTSISFVGKFICNGRNKFRASYNTGLLFPRILDSRATFKAVLMAVDMT